MMRKQYDSDVRESRFSRPCSRRQTALNTATRKDFFQPISVVYSALENQAYYEAPLHKNSTSCKQYSQQHVFLGASLQVLVQPTVTQLPGPLTPHFIFQTENFFYLIDVFHLRLLYTTTT